MFNLKTIYRVLCQLLCWLCL